MNIKFTSLAFLLLGLVITSCNKKVSWEDTLKTKMNHIADSLTANLLEWEVPNQVFKVEDFGAIADSATVNTVAIQNTIDACSEAGGGVVLFSEGNYVTGTIDMKSGVMLEIAEGAFLLGSTNLNDYPDRVAKTRTVMDTYMDIRHSLIYAEGVERVGVRGPGTIDFRGQKENFPGKETIAKLPGRPFGMRFIESDQIVVKNINLKNSASWMQDYLNCTNLIFDGINNENHSNHNQDGLDIDGCRYIIVRNCHFNVYDDAMCIKGAGLGITQDMLIENSTFYTKCNSLKIGTDTQGHFRRIFARNLVLGGPEPEYPAYHAWSPTESGITLATVDGGDVEDILIQNVEINRANCPVFIRIGSRGRLMPGMPPAPIGKLERILIEDVTGKDNLKQGSFISGIKDGIINDVTIRNMNVSMQGGIQEMPNEVRENEKGYPDAHQFDNPLPAIGFYVRHAKNITLENIAVTPLEKDERPPFISGGNNENVWANGELLK